MTPGDRTSIEGRVQILLHGPDGVLKEAREARNLVVDAGRAVVADRMQAAPSKAAMTHMAVGTNNTAPAAGNTALGAEVARVALISTGVQDNVITYQATFGPGVGTGALTEAGLFNAGVAGDMLARVTFSVVNKGAADALVITWTVTMTPPA